MAESLDAAARTANEALRALERAAADSRSTWDDATRNAFDRRYSDQILAAGKKAASELQSLASDLATALRGLE